MQNKRVIGILLGSAFLLLAPLVAMQFTRAVSWGPLDFAVAGVLIFVTGTVFELAARSMQNAVYRKILGGVLLVVLLLLWADLAIGIFTIPGFSGN